jgi:hypothetical protein
MSTPAELREEYRLTKEALAKATSPEVKRQLTQRAFALAQLAENLERDGMAQREPLPRATRP